MKTLQYLFMTVASLLVLAVAAPTVTYADNVFSGVDCSGKAAGSVVCQEQGTTKDPLTGNGGLLMNIINIIALVTGIAAVIIIIISALRMVAGGGSSDAVAGARRGLIYALVGLVIVATARLIIGFVLSKL